jgi:hypothetical protein
MSSLLVALRKVLTGYNHIFVVLSDDVWFSNLPKPSLHEGYLDFGSNCTFGLSSTSLVVGFTIACSTVYAVQVQSRKVV